MELPLTGIVFTLLFAAFFSAMEIAYISSSRLKVELDKAKGTINGRILGQFYKKQSHFIAMLLLVNNVALVFFGLFAGQILNPVLASWGIPDGGAWMLVIQTLVSTALVLVIAEFLPKAIVQLNPNGFLRLLALPMFVIYVVMYFPTFLILWLSNLFLRMLHVDNEDQEKVFTKVDLEHYVDDLNHRIKDEEEFGNEMQILKNALDFDSVKARDCMVPRTDIVSIDVDKSIDELRLRFIDTGLSKIIVYRENIDNIIGYVHSFEMFKSPKSIKQILLPINFVPESIPGKELLQLFAEKSGNLAVVVDEYGGTSGIVTIEDVIEEIFGDIEDEHDKEDWIEDKISDDEFLFSARIDIDYLNAEYEFDLETNEEYETLGGLIIHELESIPSAGTRIVLKNLVIEIEEVSDHRIDVVRIIKQ
jgi:putative hemolysin